MTGLEEIESFIGSNRICSCGRKHRSTLQKIVMRPHAVDSLQEILQYLRVPPQKTALICGAHGYELVGKQLEQTCSFSQTIHVKAQDLQATETTVELVGSQLLPCELLVCVGSSTIHDIVKYVAQERGLRFVSIPTAASVDGYVSNVAAMTWHGVKKTLPAVAPVAILVDTQILADAPERLTRSGIGEMIGNYMSIFDWRVAHMLTGEYICEEIVRMEYNGLQRVIDNLEALDSRNTEAVAELMSGLLLSGMAMQMVGNSRPSSGSEHQISHLIEMGTLLEGNRAMHGEKVGVATALCCDQCHALLEKEITLQDFQKPRLFPAGKIRQAFGPLANDIIRLNFPDPLARVTAKSLVRKWPEIRKLARETLPTGEEIRAILRRARCCTVLEDIQVPETLLPELLAYSPFVRNRLTLLRAATLLKPEIICKA